MLAIRRGRSAFTNSRRVYVLRFRKRLRSTNLLERSLEEVKRWTWNGRLGTLAEETYALRRMVSGDGRTDLATLHHQIHDRPSAWHLGAVDKGVGWWPRQACMPFPAASTPRSTSGSPAVHGG